MKNKKMVRVCLKKRTGAFLTMFLMTATLLTACGNNEDSATIPNENNITTQKQETKDITTTKEATKDNADDAQKNKNAAENGIDKETALSTALEHAGRTLGNVEQKAVKEDVENGVKVYEISFYTSEGMAYDYKINREDGTIMSFEHDARALLQESQAADTGIISEDKVQEIVLERVPNVEKEKISITQDEEDGRKVYEVYLMKDNMKHEFKIDAYSGSVIEWDADVNK